MLSLLSKHVKLQAEAWDTHQQVTEARRALKRELSGPEERPGYHLPRGTQQHLLVLTAGGMRCRTSM